jgi:cobalt-zinc-cadmium efflux system membrane fusion protein
MKKITLTAIVFLLLISCGNQKNESAPHIGTDVGVRASETIVVNNDEETDALTSATRTNNRPIFNGTLVIPPQRHVTVTLFMDGIVKNTSLISGMFVRTGQVLATFEKPEYITLQQSYIESHAQEEFLEAEYLRQKSLFGNEVASQKILQQARADYLAKKSQREAIAMKLRLLGFDPKRTLSEGIKPYLELRAPISGYVANVQINIGKYIAAGEPICDIIDKSTLLVKLTVFERDIGKIKNGDKIEFRVTGLGNQTFYATVVSLGQNVDNVSRSIEVFARVTGNNTQFRPGMYVNAQIVEP